MTKPKASKRVTKASQILALSDKGLPPNEISKILGVKLQYIYTTRAQMKGRGIGRWHQLPDALQPKAPPKPTNPAINAYNLNLNPYQPQITFIEEPKRSLFTRIRAAYAVLRGA